MKKFNLFNTKSTHYIDIFIDLLDKETFIEINGIDISKFKDFKEYMYLEGLSGIKNSKLLFYKGFQHFNEDRYIKLFPDIKYAVDNKKFASGFEHFCTYGYKEIVENKRVWPKTDRNYLKSIIKNFDEESFYEANRDIIENESNIKSDLETELLFKSYIADIQSGKLLFHKYYTEYNEELYLKIFSDVKNSIEEGNFKNGFEHFCNYGYNEIILQKRVWPKRVPKELKTSRFFNINISDIHLTNNILNSYQQNINYLNNFIEQNNSFRVIVHNINFMKMLLIYNEYDYLLANKDILKSISNRENSCGLEHFIRFGYKEIMEGKRELFKKSPLKKSSVSEDEYIQILYNEYKRYINHRDKVLNTIKNSGLFIEPYYTKNSYSKIFDTISPLQHYILFGEKDNLKPNPYFEPYYYKSQLKNDPDESLLYHYIVDGEKRGLKPSKSFDPQYYIDTYLDVAQKNTPPLQHYIKYGKDEGRYATEIEENDKIIGKKNRYYNLDIQNNSKIKSAIIINSNIKDYIKSDILDGNIVYDIDDLNLKEFKDIVKELKEQNIVTLLYLNSTQKERQRVFEIENITRVLNKNIIYSINSIFKTEDITIIGDPLFFDKGFSGGFIALNINQTEKIIKKLESIENFTDTIIKNSSKTAFIFNTQKSTFIEVFEENLTKFKKYRHTKSELCYQDERIKLLSNNRLFKEDEYLHIFPKLNQYGIDLVHHYFYIGRFFMDFNIDIDKLDYNKSKLIQSGKLEYISDYGTLKEFKTKTKDDEFTLISTKMKIYESYIVDWQRELNKKRLKEFVSIVMPLYGQIEMTIESVKSIIENTKKIDYEIILVNNSQNSDEIKQLQELEESFTQIHLINNETNLNFALGCNQGFGYAIGEYVVFLNNDTKVTPNWLSNLIDGLKDENVSAVQPKLLYPDDTIQSIGVAFSNKSSLGLNLYSNIKLEDDILNQDRYLQAVTGACLGIRAKDFALVKGFDTSYINGQEDIDLCLKLVKSTNRYCKYISNSTVYHYESKSKGRGRFVAQNRKVFIKRWSKYIKPDIELQYSKDGFKIIEWELDSKELKRVGVENYLPKTEKSVLDDTKYLNFYKSNFKIKGHKRVIKSNKNILLVAHSINETIFGGERSFLDIVKAVSKMNINLYILTPSFKNEKYIDMLKEYSIDIFHLNYVFWNKKGVIKESVTLIEDILENKSIDLVYVNTIMHQEALIAAKNRGIKSVIHIREIISHDEHLQKTINMDLKEIYDHIHYYADNLIANSKITAKMFQRDKYIPIVYNKIDIDRFDIEHKLGDVINVGLLSSNQPKKGIYDMVEIAKRLQTVDNLQFTIYGPVNDHTKKIQEKISRYGLKNIKIGGYIDEPTEAFKKINILLSLSHFAESFGRTVGEAMASKRAVVAYDFGAVGELIDDNQSGYLVEYKNIDKVVEKLKIYANNPQLIIRHGLHGYKKIKSISSEDIYNKKLSKILKNILSNKKSPNKKEPQKEVSVVVPIYNAYIETKNLILSLTKTIDSNSTIYLSNDGSSDKRVLDLINKYTKLPYINSINHKKNIGYTKNINFAIKRVKSNSDIILLNSDTITTNFWIENLKKEAYRDKNTGTVTAMSDNAGAFSIPLKGKANPKPKDLHYQHYAHLMTKDTSVCSSIKLPTGSGFCFYIKRDLIDTIGLFNEKDFPRGYGEENEFCLRAIDSGYTNIFSTSVFIYHIRTASFKDEKQKLVESAIKKIEQFYPDYHERLRIAFSSREYKELVKSAKNVLTKIEKER